MSFSMVVGYPEETEEARWGNPSPFMIEHSISSYFYLDTVHDSGILDLNNDGYEDFWVWAEDYNATDVLILIDLNTGATLAYEEITDAVTDITPYYVDGDAYPEFVVEESDLATDEKVEVFSTSTLAWEFDSGWRTGSLEWDVIGPSFILGYTDNLANQNLRLYFYDNSTYTSTWTSPMRWRFGTWDNQWDLDGDGLREVTIRGSWVPVIAHLYVITVANNTVVLNTSNYLSQALMELNVIDLDMDGFMELVVWSRPGPASDRMWVYSASIWSEEWSTQLWSEIIEGQQYGDVDNDGVLDIIFIVNNGGPQRVLVYDGATGTVDLSVDYEQFANFWVRDCDGDDIDDLFVANSSATSDTRHYRLYKGGTLAMQYNQTTPKNNLWYEDKVVDVTGDGVGDLYRVEYDTTGPTTIYRVKIYLLAAFTMHLQTQDFDYGSGGSGQVSYKWYEQSWLPSAAPPPGPNDGPTNLFIRWRYDDPVDTNDYEQIYLYDCVAGTLAHRSARIYGTAQHKIVFEEADLDEDGWFDYYYDASWYDTAETDIHGNITFLMSNPWRVAHVHDLHDYDTLTYNVQNIDVNSDGNNDTWLYATINFDGWWFYNTTLFNNVPTTFTTIYEYNDNDAHTVMNPDLNSDDNGDLAIAELDTAGTRLYMIDASGAVPVQLQKLYLPRYTNIEVYGYDFTDDGESLVLILGEFISGNDELRFYVTSDWSLVHTQTSATEGGAIIDLDQDGIDNFLNFEANPGSDPETKINYFELEDGTLEWTSEWMYHIIALEVYDLNSDTEEELIMLHIYLDDLSQSVYQYQVNNVYINQEPVTTDIPDVIMDEDTSDSSVQLSSFITDVEALTYTASIDVPEVNMTLAPDSTLTFTPDPDWFGNATVTAEAFDGKWTVQWMFNVSVQPTNDMPVINSVDAMVPAMKKVDLTVTQENWNNYTINATDIDGDVLNFSIADPTENMTINMTTGVFSFMPLPADGLTAMVNVTVKDDNGSSDYVVLNISINNVDHAPMDVEITAPETYTVVEGLFTLEGTATDLDIPWGDTLNFTWESELDGELGYGATLDDVNLSVGSHNITLTVTDSTGLTGTDMIVVNMSDGSVEPEWWITGFEPDKEPVGDLDIEFYAAVRIFNMTDDGTDTTMSTYYKLSGLSSEEIIIVIYSAMQMDDDDYTFYPMADPNEPTESVMIEPVDGIWVWESWYNLTFPTPDPVDGADGDDPPVITYWFACVGWDNWGNYDIDFASAVEEDPGDPVKTIDPEWWLMGTTDDDIEDIETYDSAVEVAWVKCDVETTIVDNGDDTTTMTTTYDFEGTCSDEVTVVYIYTGTSIDGADFTYYGMADPDDMMKKVEIDAESGAWSATYTSELTYPTPEPVTDGGDGDGGDPPTVETFYLAVGWAPTGFGYDTIKLGEEPGDGGDGGDGNGTDGNGTDGGDGTDGDGEISSTTFYGLLAGVIILAVIVVILFFALIIAIVVGGKKKKGADEPSEDELPPPPPEDGEVAEGQVGPGEEDLPPPEDGEELPPPEEAEVGEDAAPPEDEVPEDVPEPEEGEVPEPEAPEEGEEDVDFEMDEEPPEESPEDPVEEEDLEIDDDADFDLDDEDEPPLD